MDDGIKFRLRMNWCLRLLSFILSVAAVSSCQCSKSDANKPPAGQTLASADQLVLRGKSVYSANCISCHNPNPKLAGSLGPEVWGSSKQLIEERVVRGGYPEGYQPKRKSKVMAALPHLASDVEALAAYLNSSL